MFRPGPLGPAASFAVAVVLLLTVAPPSVPGAPLASPASTAAPAGSPLVPHGLLRTQGFVPTRPMATGNNTLVVGNCSSGGNAEVEQAYDAANGYLYEAWIGCQGIGFSRSTDGGLSFGSVQTVPGSLGYSWDPAIALAPNGTLYVAYMTNQGFGDTPMVAWSTNHGSSFAGDAPVFAPTGSDFGDRDFIAVAPNGTLYVTWDYSPNASIDQIGCAPGGSCYFVAGDYNIVLARSADGGRHWSPPVAVDPEYPWGGGVAAPLLIEPNGTVDILYEDYATNQTTHALGRGQNYFTQSTDGGRTFSQRTAISNVSFANTVWWIDGDLSRDAGGTLYATFDGTNGTNDTAYVAYSTTDGASWSPSIRLNPDQNSAVHVMVGVAGAGPGTAFVAWMTNNSTAAGWVTVLATLTANATNLTVSAPTIVSDQVGVAGYWIGDTLGLSALGGTAVAVSWSYGVDLNGTIDSEVYAAVVGLAPPGQPTIQSIVPGAGNVSLTWSAPNGSLPVTGYTVRYGIEGQAPTNLTVSASTTEALLSGLQPYSRYLVNVTAFNSAGPGLPSATRAFMLTAWAVIRGTVVPQTANVTIDGTPVAVVLDHFSLNTTPGTHLVRASAPDFTAQSQGVDAAWNATTSVALVLAPANGTVAGSVRPATANVTWDGAAVPVNSSGRFAIVAPAGTVHVLSASAYGYQNVTLTVEVPDNATVNETLNLTPENGTLALRVAPGDSQVWLDGASVTLGPGGVGNFSRAPGVYSVRVQRAGYFPNDSNYTVRALAVTNVSITLLPLNGTGGSGTGGSPFSPLVILGLVAGTLAVLVAAALLVGRKGRREPPAPETPGDPGPIWPEERPPTN